MTDDRRVPLRAHVNGTRLAHMLAVVPPRCVVLLEDAFYVAYNI